MLRSRYFKIFLGITAALSLLSPLLFPYLALSLKGIEQGFFWQLISYLFVEPTAANNFSSLLHLAFNLFLLWTFGAPLLQRGHWSLFYLLYFLSGLLASAIALGLMALTGSSLLFAGNSPALYGVLIGWVLLHPNAKLLLFFAVPFHATWLLLGLIGANLLIDLSNGLWIPFFSYAGACLFAYIFSLIAWRVESSISFLHPFERFTFRCLERIRHLFRKKKSFKSAKIYDIKSGAPILNDEQFMDAMLARISRHGEDSLTPTEQERMRKISEKRKN